MQKGSLLDVWLVFKCASGFRNSHWCSLEKAVLKNFAILGGKHMRCSLILTKLQAFFLVFSLNAKKKLKKKKMWLLLFLMLVATYHFYEKGSRKMCTTIVSYFFNIHTFKTKSKIFLIFEIGNKTSISYKKFSWK